MKNNNKKMVVILLLLVLVAFYYFLLPNRNWFGKPYLETNQKDGFAVVELFTSEGCSSCPPAEELIAKIQKETDGKNIYFLAFHVDYWDHLNWKDPFGAPEFSERQEQYIEHMNQKLIYTPQFIINGTSEFAGDDARTLYRIVSNALQKKPESTLALQADVKQDSITVKYKTNKVDKNTVLFVALVQKNAVTNVKRGENGGRLLHHVQIVRQTSMVPMDKKKGSLSISVPEGFNTKEWELIGLIQNQSTGAINAAAKAKF